MKHQISAFMDGELIEEETDALLAALRRDEALTTTWATFHVISDALKEHYSRDLSSNFVQGIRQRLHEEPTVLAPERLSSRRPRKFALTAAASVAAIATVFGITFYTNTSTEVGQEVSSATNHVDDYLLAHQEFSPSTMMQGMAPYVRTVSVARETK